MTKNRDYFAQVLLTDGSYCNLVFSSDYRRGTHGNQLDLLLQSNGKADINTDRYMVRKHYRGKRYNELSLHDYIHQ